MIRLTNRGWTVGSITRRIRICAINTPSATINWRANISAATGVKRGVGNIGTTATGDTEGADVARRAPPRAVAGGSSARVSSLDLSRDGAANQRPTIEAQEVKIKI